MGPARIKQGETCSSRIAAEMERRTGVKGEPVIVVMKGLGELGQFIRTMEEARKASANSTTRYGEAGA